MEAMAILEQAHPAQEIFQALGHPKLHNMARSHLSFTLFGVLATLLLLLSSSISASPVAQRSMHVRTDGARTPQDVVEAVRRGIGSAANSSQGFHWEGSSSLDKSWNGAVLLQL